MSDHVSKNDEDYWKNMKRGSVWVNIMIEYNGVFRTRNFLKCSPGLMYRML